MFTIIKTGNTNMIIKSNKTNAFDASYEVSSSTVRANGRQALFNEIGVLQWNSGIGRQEVEETWIRT